MASLWEVLTKKAEAEKQWVKVQTIIDSFPPISEDADEVKPEDVRHLKKDEFGILMHVDDEILNDDAKSMIAKAVELSGGYENLGD